jgi:hypothetical protein
VRKIEGGKLHLKNNKTGKESHVECDAIKQAWLVIAKLDINKNY